MRKVNEEYASTRDYLLAKVFGFTPRSIEGSKLQVVDDIPPMMVFTANDFPYNCADPIQHWLVWSTTELNLQMVEEYLHSAVPKKFGTGALYICLLNPPNHQSIRDLFHVHVFINPRLSISRQIFQDVRVWVFDLIIHYTIQL